MELRDLVQLCEEYNSLGWAVQEQLRNVINRPDSIIEQNSNALNRIQRFLTQVSRVANRTSDKKLDCQCLELFEAIEENLNG